MFSCPRSHPIRENSLTDGVRLIPLTNIIMLITVDVTFFSSNIDDVNNAKFITILYLRF